MSGGASPWRTISVALTASTAGYTTGLSSASAQTKAFGRQVSQTTQSSGAKWKSFTKGATVGVALLATALAASAREAINWESAFAGVRKTVNATEAEYSQLSDTLLAMARRMPATRTEIAGVAEAAGQLGIAKEDIANFTEIAIGLGTATNLSADEAATGLARLSNIMGTSAQDFDRLGSTLVDLGNKGASTESEILEMATRMAGAGKLVGLTEANVLALANALSSLGVQSELGSGVTTRFLTKMYSAVQEGGKSLAPWAKAARVSASEFAKAYSTEPVKALEMVVKGMSDTKAEGGNVVALLADLGLKGTQNTQVLTALAGGYEVLHQSIADGNQAWTENVALQAEVDQRYKTAASQLAIFGNQVTDVMRIVGAQLIPVMLAGMDGFRAFAAWASETGAQIGSRLNPAIGDISKAIGDLGSILADLYDAGEPVVKLLVTLGGAAIIGGLTVAADVLEHLTGFLAHHGEIVAVVVGAWVGLRAAMLLADVAGAALMVLNNVVIGLSAMAAQAKAAAIGMATMQTSVTTGMSMIGTSVAAGTTAMGLFKMAVAGAFAGALLVFSALATSAAKARANVEKLKPEGFDDKSIASLRTYADNIQEAGVNAQVASDKQGGWKGTIKGTVEVMSPMKNSVVDQRNAVVALSAAQEANNKKLAEMRWRYIQAHDAVYGTTQALDYIAAVLSGRSVAGFDAAATATERWIEKLDLPPEVVNNPERLAAAITEAKDAAENGTPATDAMAASYKVLGDETSSATDKLDAWATLVDETFGTPMGVEEATTKWGEAISTLTDKLKPGAWAGFDELTEKGRENRDVLGGAAKSALDMAKAYAKAGRTDEAVVMLRNTRQALLDAGTAAGMSKDDVEAFLDKLGLIDGNYDAVIAALVDPQGAAQAEADLSQLARDRTAVITAIVAGQSSGKLDDYHYRDRWGGVHEHARWGRIPAHVTNQPTILYGERETGGEAMIPKRGNYGRSMGILGTAASWYGASVVPAGAAGGNGGLARQVAALAAAVAARPAVSGPLVQVNPAPGMSERRIGEVASEQTAKALAGVGGHR